MNIHQEMLYGKFNLTSFIGANLGKKRKDKNRSKYKPHYGKQAAERNFKRMNKVA